MKTGLLHPYPGSKKDWQKYPVWDERQYDAVLEPFVGSGHFTHRMLANGRVKNAFVGDIDPAVNVVWRFWMDTEPDEFGYFNGECGRDFTEDFANSWVAGIQAVLLDSKSPDYPFERLKEWLEEGIETDPHKLAAASIILRKLVFGGVLRCNAQGKLNVALSQDKLKQFLGWQFKWPYFSSDWRLSVSDSWQQCLDKFAQSDCQNAIAFVDPPYWLPPKSRPGRRGTGAMTPAYTHHGNPQGQGTLDLFIECLDYLLGCSRVKRVVATNYVSPELQLEVDELMKKHDCHGWFTPLGTLATMNNGSSREDCPIEGFWEFGGRRMAGRYQQKELFELEVAA